MLKFLPHKAGYWKKNKPKQIGNQKLTTDDWNKVITILERIDKRVSYKKIATYYERKKGRELDKNYFSFINPETKIEALKEHATLMTYIYDQEKKRQENMDNKARQVMTNVSVVFAFITFSSTIILNKDNYIKDISLYSLLSVAIALTAALAAIILAVRCLDVKVYSRPREEIVFDPKCRLEDDFLRQKTSDFFFALYHNTGTTSKKSRSVKSANRLFIISLGFVGFFTILNLYAINVRNEAPAEEKVQVIKLKDTIDVRIQKTEVKDTLEVKIVKPKSSNSGS